MYCIFFGFPFNLFRLCFVSTCIFYMFTEVTIGRIHGPVLKSFSMDTKFWTQRMSTDSKGMVVLNTAYRFPADKNDGFRPFDCLDIYNSGKRRTGVYEIFPLWGKGPVEVKCDMDLLGGGWTVIQYRSRLNKKVNFNTTWEAYKNGFGDAHSNYWLGNTIIHELTTKFQNSLYIKMRKLSERSINFAQYSTFSISNQTTDFRLSLGKYSGNKGDAFRSHGIIGHKFSTYDHDYNTCAKQCRSGWWYNSCTLVNLNAPFFDNHRDPVWNGYISKGTKCAMTEMLIRRKK